LLNEVQRLHQQLAAQESQLAEVSELKQQLAELRSVVAKVAPQADGAMR